MYVCMLFPDRVVSDHDSFILMIIYMYVCMSLSYRVVRDSSCGGMISYVGKWHEVPGLMRNKVGRVALKSIQG